ncbi:TFPT-like protein [Mya arenaria]|uniref:TFPT-like protein n=1 Tax=Mya arenaria TaxID=6604 RepID=A0ABY7DNF4_MYAAR|nr:TFPT-like protein [Mya arenaria]
MAEEENFGENVFMKKYLALRNKCEHIQQGNERLVNRLQHVKKLVRTYNRQRKFLQRRLDGYKDNYWDAQVPVMWEEKKTPISQAELTKRLTLKWNSLAAEDKKVLMHLFDDVAMSQVAEHYETRFNGNVRDIADSLIVAEDELKDTGDSFYELTKGRLLNVLYDLQGAGVDTTNIESIDCATTVVQVEEMMSALQNGIKCLDCCESSGDS